MKKETLTPEQIREFAKVGLKRQIEKLQKEMDELREHYEDLKNILNSLENEEKTNEQE